MIIKKSREISTDCSKINPHTCGSCYPIIILYICLVTKKGRRKSANTQNRGHRFSWFCQLHFCSFRWPLQSQLACSETYPGLGLSQETRGLIMGRLIRFDCPAKMEKGFQLGYGHKANEKLFKKGMDF